MIVRKNPLRKWVCIRIFFKEKEGNNLPAKADLQARNGSRRSATMLWKASVDLVWTLTSAHDDALSFMDRKVSNMRLNFHS